ncbi:hypothetical protein SFC43_13810 [Bacteroides sp. CR5/BHMF/2]|nr:hypothetical protein [Bacteroides sp. CR5/BHMF/2]
MKKLFPILLLAILLMLSSCIKDELDACAGRLHIYFSYIYGQTNQFYETAKTDVHLNYYYKESGEKYRETLIERASIDIDKPYVKENREKTRIPSPWWPGHTMIVWNIWMTPLRLWVPAMSV